MGHEAQRRAADPRQPPHRVLVPWVLRRLPGPARIELSFLTDARDPPAIRVAGFWIRLRASEVAEVPPGVRELSERHERVDRRGLLADDGGHPAHVSPTCTQSSGGMPSVPPGLSRSPALSSALRRRRRGRLGPAGSW